MTDPREQQFLDLVKDFPDSPMGHFSLGKHYLEIGRFAEAVQCLSRAAQLDATYVAALVALGDAHLGARQEAEAREVLTRARELAVAQKHLGLAEEIDERLESI